MGTGMVYENTIGRALWVPPMNANDSEHLTLGAKRKKKVQEEHNLYWPPKAVCTILNNSILVVVGLWKVGLCHNFFYLLYMPFGMSTHE